MNTICILEAWRQYSTSVKGYIILYCGQLAREISWCMLFIEGAPMNIISEVAFKTITEYDIII